MNETSVPARESIEMVERYSRIGGGKAFLLRFQFLDG